MKDIEKYNAAAILGWVVYRVTVDSLKDGTAIEEIARHIRDKLTKPLPHLAKCKACGRGIYWMKTQANRNMPVDPEGVEPGDSIFDHTKHTSHFTTCPNADDMRRRK